MQWLSGIAGTPLRTSVYRRSSSRLAHVPEDHKPVFMTATEHLRIGFKLANSVHCHLNLAGDVFLPAVVFPAFLS